MIIRSTPVAAAPSPHGEKGAYIVELAIVLPVYLMIIFFIIDIARIGLVYSTLRSAVFFATRQASAPLRKEWDAVGTAFGTNLAIGHSQILTKLNVAPEFISSSSESPAWYRCMARNTPAGACEFDTESRYQIDELYRVEAAAIAIANSIIAENIGGVRYPCENEPTCARCFTLRGDQDDYDDWFKYFGHSWFTRNLALKCKYDVPLLTAGLFLGAFPDHFTISSEWYHGVNHFPGGAFQP